MSKKSLIKILIVSFFIISSFVTISFATDINEDVKILQENVGLYNSKFISEDGFIYPIIHNKDYYSATYSDTFLNKYSFKASYLDNSYNLTNDIKVNVYNQGEKNTCWIFGLNSVLETTRAKEKNEYVTYDVDYIERKTTEIFNRKIYGGGNPLMLLAFYTDGYGPLTVSTNKVDTQIGDYCLLSTVYKGYDQNGNIQYNGGDVTEEEVIANRNLIKKHIVEYGGVTACMCSDKLEYFSNPTIDSYLDSEAYFCDFNYNYRFSNLNNIAPDHQVTIIGWDDNYSKNNFNQEHRPQKDGAYIVLNSWGENFSKDGIFYVSYEDTFIESSVVGVSNVDKIDYDNLYQHDEYGLVDAISFGEVVEFGANIFTKSDKIEKLKEISVANVTESSYEIYVNPKNDNLNFENLVKVAEKSNLEPGFHTIQLDNEVLLTGTKFAVVVKYKNKINNSIFLGVECNAEGTAYTNGKINSGESFVYSKDTGWVDLKDIVNNSRELSNVCNLNIKAFTEETGEKIDENIDVSSNKYKIENGYIKGITCGTTKNDLLYNIQTTATNVEIYEGENKISSTNILKTRMKIVFSNNTKKEEFLLVVIGDCTGDGNADIKDMIRINNYRLFKTNFDSEGYQFAADVNKDKKVDIKDMIMINNYRLFKTDF